MTLHPRAEQLAALLPPLLIDAERVANTIWQGVHGRRRAGVGESFWQFRRYDAGDPAERIDWRQSARTDKLYIRLREWEAAQTACLWADVSGSMHYASATSLPTKADRAQLLLLALTSLLLRGGEKILWSEGDRFVTVNGKQGLERIAAEFLSNANSKSSGVPLPLAGGARGGLANRVPVSTSPPSVPPVRLRQEASARPSSQDLVEAKRRRASGREAQTASSLQNNLPSLPPTTRNAHIILASDFLMPADALQERLRRYAAQNLRGVLLHIIDPLEQSFALDGRVELQGLEGETALLVPSANALRDAYRQRFAEHQARLQTLAQSAGWFYQRHVTDETPQGALLKIYNCLAV